MSTSFLQVRIQPAARQNEILGLVEGVLRVRVTALPERGLANEALATLLAKRLGIPRSSIALVRGATSRTKTLAIEGVTREEIEGRLATGQTGGRAP